MTENIQEKIKEKVIDCINSGTGGRLIIFKPEGSAYEPDLVVERRGKYEEEKIYFKINSISGHVKDNNFVKDFLQEGFMPDKNFYLLFVYFDEIKQKVSDYVWLVPSSQFRDVAEVIKSPEGENLLRFEAPIDVQNFPAQAGKNKYSKFIVNTKELGELILNAIEKKTSINFKEINFEGTEKINLDNLKKFLCEARRNTYAANATSLDNPRLVASTQLEFQKGDYFYRDIYFLGVEKFIGQEIVYHNQQTGTPKPIWGMNYIGDTIGKVETIFLKESLFKLSEKCRFGQVCEYKKREFKYQDRGQGSLEEFSGKEEIFLDGKNIYKLDYQGGLIV